MSGIDGDFISIEKVKRFLTWFINLECEIRSTYFQAIHSNSKLTLLPIRLFLVRQIRLKLEQPLAATLIFHSFIRPEDKQVPIILEFNWLTKISANSVSFHLYRHVQWLIESMNELKSHFNRVHFDEMLFGNATWHWVLGNGDKCVRWCRTSNEIDRN